MAGVAFLVLACAAAGRPGAQRLLGGACLLLVAAACLPLGHALLPAASQPYRLNAPALLLALVLGATAAPAAVAAARARAARAALLVLLGVVWAGLGLAQASSWGADRAGASARPRCSPGGRDSAREPGGVGGRDRLAPLGD